MIFPKVLDQGPLQCTVLVFSPRSTRLILARFSEDDRSVLDVFLSNVKCAPVTPTMMIFLTPYVRSSPVRRSTPPSRSDNQVRYTHFSSLVVRKVALRGANPNQKGSQRSLCGREIQSKVLVHIFINDYSLKPKKDMPSQMTGLFMGWVVFSPMMLLLLLSLLRVVMGISYCPSHEQQAVQTVKSSYVTSVSYHPEI